MLHRSSLLWLGLSWWALVPVRPAGAEDPISPVAELLAASEDDREAVQERWRGTPDAERARAAMAALHSADPRLARAGAVLVDPLWLDLAGLARLDQVLAADPLARFVPGEALDGVVYERHAFGSADLPRIWKALVSDSRDVAPPYAGLHRSLTHAHVAELVPLLATLPDAHFRALFWDIMNQSQGEVDDTRHDLYVRAFRYGLLRLAALEEGKERPGFDALPPVVGGPGIPAEALELVRAAWAAPASGFDALRAPQGSEGRQAPDFWLARWLRRIGPVEADLEHLLEIARMPNAPMQARHWAGSWAARFEGSAAGRVLQQILEGAKGDAAADAAAAEAAARGRPEAWRERVPDPLLRWRAEPEQALEHAWRTLQAGELPDELEPDERTFNAYDLGVEIPADAMAALVQRLRAGGAPARAELAFFARVIPEQMSIADAERILTRLAEHAQRAEAEAYMPPRGDLALLEVRAPAALVELLRRWVVPGAPGADTQQALELLARLGDAAHADKMLKRIIDEQALGRVKDPPLEAALRKALEQPSDEEDALSEEDALDALAVLYGLPEDLTSMLLVDDEGGTRRFEQVRDLVLARDPVGAVLLHATTRDVWDVGSFAGFSRLKDPRVPAQLRAWRAAPELGLRWPATGALALSGDADARREWIAFLAQARTFLLDDVHAAALFTLDGDPELVTAWIERLSENCCYAWHAGLALKHLFPTAPWEQTAGDGGRACWRARLWWKENRGHLAYSRLVDGWVPAAR